MPTTPLRLALWFVVWMVDGVERELDLVRWMGGLVRVHGLGLFRGVLLVGAGAFVVHVVHLVCYSPQS